MSGKMLFMAAGGCCRRENKLMFQQDMCTYICMQRYMHNSADKDGNVMPETTVLYLPETAAHPQESNPSSICRHMQESMGFVRMQAEPTIPAAGSSNQAGRPKTPDAKAGSSNSSTLGQCFGMGKTVEEAEQEELPLGVVGLRNLGEPLYVPWDSAF